jgi:pyruvate formate lyase activating enzyme
MIEGFIFSIEEFAIHDGPGIRTTVFLKGCPLRCEWCHNPEGISFKPQYLKKKSGQTLCGYKISSEELAQKIIRNKKFFELNNGGITFTGGEPLAQPKFLIDVLQRIAPIHKAIETSGHASISVFREVVGLVDLVLFDIKHMNTSEHKKYTGVENHLILQNLDYLISGNKDFIIRIPLIPGVNDSEGNILNILSLIRDAKSLVRIELLPYHKTAGAKYEMLGQTYKPSFDTTKIPEIHNVFEKNNVKTIIL